MSALAMRWRQLRNYPSAVVGLIVIAMLVIVSIATPLVLPYSEAIRLWRGGDQEWRTNPRNAAPAWQNLFTETDQAATIVFNSAEGDGEQVAEQLSADTREVRYIYEFEFPYDTFPPELILFTSATYASKQPFVELLWYTPDGREIRAGEFTPTYTASCGSTASSLSALSNNERCGFRQPSSAETTTDCNSGSKP